MNALCWILALLAGAAAVTADERPPNFIVIFCDDLGYGDLGCYGSKENRTPHIDALARQGMRFTDFYSSSPVCTPSRASLLTGCYPRRVGLHEDATGHWVLIPRSRRGFHPDEETLPELLKKSGYRTACIGKWHLGDQPGHLPTDHGFDSYYGIPYSNDMQRAERGDPPLPLVEGTKVIEAPADQSTLTRRYTEKAVEFIHANKTRPFFLYLPHTFPHLPLFASPGFKGKSANGIYGDSIEEIDWSTGEIMKALDEADIADNTLLIFTSDNGSNAKNGGSNAPLAGTKGSTMEGGMRVPMIARFPKAIPAGAKCEVLTTTMDFLPTFCALSGAKGPKAKIDGHDITKLLKGDESAKSPYEALYYYRRRQLQAIRWGDWKWHLPLDKTFPNWTTAKKEGPGRPGKLVDLTRDLKEEHDLSSDHPEVIVRMKKLMDQAAATLGNEATMGTGQRPSLTLSTSKPMLLHEPQ